MIPAAECRVVGCQGHRNAQRRAKCARHARRRNARAMSEAVLSIVRADAEATSIHAVARRLAVEHTTVSRWLSGRSVPGCESIDAIAVVYGLGTMQRAVAAVRHRRMTADERAS